MASLTSDTINTLLAQPNASSSAPLAGGAQFNSGYQPTDGYGRIVGGVFADQAGTLVVYQTTDPAHYSASQTVAVSANTATPFSVEVVQPLYALILTNGATAQTLLHLQTNLRRI